MTTQLLAAGLPTSRLSTSGVLVLPLAAARAAAAAAASYAVCQTQVQASGRPCNPLDTTRSSQEGERVRARKMGTATGAGARTLLCYTVRGPGSTECSTKANNKVVAIAVRCSTHSAGDWLAGVREPQAEATVR